VTNPRWWSRASRMTRCRVSPPPGNRQPVDLSIQPSAASD
jgi:hypothetical protein